MGRYQQVRIPISDIGTLAGFLSENQHRWQDNLLEVGTILQHVTELEAWLTGKLPKKEWEGIELLVHAHGNMREYGKVHRLPTETRATVQRRKGVWVVTNISRYIVASHTHPRIYLSPAQRSKVEKKMLRQAGVAVP